VDIPSTEFAEDVVVVVVVVRIKEPGRGRGVVGIPRDVLLEVVAAMVGIVESAAELGRVGVVWAAAAAAVGV